MAEVDGVAPPAFDYELYEGDPDHLRTVVSTPDQPSPLIDSSSLRLKHRIGHGPFGDVWLATHHQSAQDFDEYHEVAVKMLCPLKKNCIPKFLNKFQELFPKLRRLQRICWLHGISVISEKICIAMKFYDGSVGDRMAQLKGGKLPLSDVLRYGIELAKGIRELHSLGILVLNLKPTNLLLDEHEHLILGDFGIPYLLLGLELPDPDLALRLGSPNYMAPEQWEPQVRGPITFETDTWGFGCSIVEMLTGVQPWFGKSVDEIFQSVINQEKPQIPCGLPPAVENVLNGCFEYDLRNRPLLEDILLAFESSLNAVCTEGEWIGLGNRTVLQKTSGSNYSTWFLSKDHLQVGDEVRSRRILNCSKPQNMAVAKGKIVGLEKDTDRDGFVLVRVNGIHNPLRVNITTLERVTSGFAVGDWVRLTEESSNRNHSSIGILHSIQRDGNVEVGFLGLETLWKGHYSQLQISEPFCVGQFVRLKGNVLSPRFIWLHKGEGTWATGRISQILPNGCLVVGFPGRLVFKGNGERLYMADPAEVEIICFEKCPGIVEKYQHIEDFHWGVRPLAIVFGVFTSMKLGHFVVNGVGQRLRKGGKSGDSKGQEGQSSSIKSGWLANILPREAAPAR